MVLNDGKILVIDDLADWRGMIGGLLQDAGYDVQSAADADEAMRLLRQQPYHVAIIDLRLDEEDENNQEGLVLAERMNAYLPELAILILTGHADIPAVKYALQPRADGTRIAFDFLEKHEISKLLPSIENAFINAARVNPQLDISLDSILSWSKLQNDIECLQPLNLEMARLEIIDLLQRIFHEAERIEIKAMNGGGHSSGAVVLATPIMRNIAQTDVVIKFNNREKAEQESRNYDGFVENYVGGARRTQRLDFRATAKLGGIAYSFVGAKATEFQRFSQAYASKDTVSIRAILDNLFKETCYTWYTNTLKPNSFQSLSAGYKEWLRLDTAKLTTTLSEMVERTVVSKLSFTNPHRPNLSDILLEERGVKLTNPRPLSQAAFAYSGPYCFTHGDLHEGNILVDSHNQTWLIDFYHTGPGHPVRDFAMLESAIKFFLQQSNCAPNMLYDWERSLIQTKSLSEKPNPDPPLQLDTELVKATELIRHIRLLLSQILPEMTIRDYQISLYFHALKGMTLSSKFNEQQKLHALISAALLAETLG